MITRGDIKRADIEKLTSLVETYEEGGREWYNYQILY